MYSIPAQNKQRISSQISAIKCIAIDFGLSVILLYLFMLLVIAIVIGNGRDNTTIKINHIQRLFLHDT